MNPSDSDNLLEFPCEFPIKVMGKTEAGFHQQVIGIVSAHAPELTEQNVSSTFSRNRNYVSVTMVVNAQSREQLDTIYRELTACDSVLMAL